MKSENVKQTREKILALIESEYESDAAFERELGLPAKTVNNWRRERSSSFMKMLPALANGFEVSVGELFDVPLCANGSEELTEDEAELLSLYRKSSVLSAKQRVALLSTLENVINLYLSSAPEKKKGNKR